MKPPFSYPRAGREADPDLSRATTRLLEEAARAGVPAWRLGPSLVQGFFRFLRWLPTRAPGIDKSQVPGLYLLLGSGTGALKMDKEDVAYQARPVGSQSCKNCSSSYRQLATGDMTCSQVEGRIIDNGWCRTWNADRN